MNLTLHIVRKDLGRMRGWIACWIALLLIPIVLGAQLLGNNPLADDRWNLPDPLTMITGFQIIVGYVLTILLLREDEVVGTRQFWLTRPISRWRLLRAKAVGALTMVGLLPVLVSLPWWLWCGFGLLEIGIAAAETLLVATLVIVPAALVATLTDSLARALLWTVALVAIGLFVMMSFAYANASVVRSRGMGLFISRAVVIVVVCAVGFAAVVAMQYRVRQRSWRLGVALALIVMSAAAGAHWPWPWISELPRERNPERAERVNVRFDRAAADPAPRRGEKEPFKRVSTYFITSGVPRELGLAGVGAWQRWRWGDGTSIERQEGVVGGSDPLGALGLRWPDNGASDPETRQWREEWRPNVDPRRLVAKAPGEAESEALAHLPLSFVVRMHAQPPSYEARVWWRLVSAELSPDLPPAAGGWNMHGPHGVRIDRFERHPEKFTAIVVETRPVFISTLLREIASAHSSFQRVRPERERVLLAMNRARGEVVDFFGDGSVRPRAAIVNGVEIRWRALRAGAPRVVRDGKWVNLTDRLEGATLGLLTIHEEALFSRTVKVERFEVSPRP